MRRQDVAARQVEVEGDLAVQVADHHRRLSHERPAADGSGKGHERMSGDEVEQDRAVLDAETIVRMHYSAAARSRPTNRALVSPSAMPSKRLCSQCRWKALTTVVVHSSYLPVGAQS